MTQITIYNGQSVETPKAGKSQLWFLCSAHHIMVKHICINFQENISNSFQVTERTHIFQCSKDSKSRSSRVTVLVFCTLSHDALHLYEVLSKYLNNFQLTELTRVHGRNGYFQYLPFSKGGNSKSRLTRAKALEFCISSHGALHLRKIP